MGRLRILTACSIMLAALIFFAKKRHPSTIATGRGLILPTTWLKPNTGSLTPAKDTRLPDQTFLTYPEWFLVFSPEEQAAYFKKYTATSFPFITHTAQIWQSYAVVNDQIKGNFPTNTGYHFMIWVIGSSASAEYAIKAWYETVIGRITDTHIVQTAEDRFNAQFTADYTAFIKNEPWYAFDFKSRLKTLWTSVASTGNYPLRKIERRYILTSELLVKYLYGKLIGLGTKSIYEEALPTTAVVVDSLPVQLSDSLHAQRLPRNSLLIYLPRYDKFGPAATRIALSGAGFREIAGNNSAILLTVLAPESFKATYDNTQLLFEQPVASNPIKKRLAYVTPVGHLNALLIKLAANKDVELEHVFDY